MEHQFQFLVASLLFTLFLIIFRALRKPISTQNLPPGPWKLPIIGNLHQLSGYMPHHRLRDLAKKYGPIMHLQLGELPVIVVSTPEVAEEVLRTHDINFANRPFVFAADILLYHAKDIGFAPYGDYWRQMRRIFTLELLSARRVKSFKSIRKEEVSKLITCVALSEGSPVNFTSMLFAVTLNIISRSAFGKLGKKESALLPLIKQIIKVAGGFTLADLFPSLKLLHVITGLKRKILSLHKKVDKILDDIINEHKEIESTRETHETNALVDVFLDLQKQGNLEVPIANENIKALVLEIFLAGTDSTSTVLEWTMSELIKNPRVMKRAQAEVREVFDQKAYVDEESLHKLNYLPLIIKETLRLHPPGPLLAPRQNREHVKLDGYDIPVKSYVIINAWAMARDQNYWTDAAKFCPERFLDNSVDYKGTDLQYIPFGAGRRMCPGMSFGLATNEFLLANLLFHFDWKLPGGINPQNLDMTEAFGGVVSKLNELCLIPIPYRPPLFN